MLRPTLLLIACTLAALTALAGDKAKRPYVAPRSDSKFGRAALAILDVNQLRGRVEEDVSAELAALGPDAIPTLFGILSGTLEGPLPSAREEGSSQRIVEVDALPAFPHQDGIVLYALSRLPSGRVIEDVTSAALARPSLDVRLVAMRVLAQSDDVTAAEAWLAITAEIEEIMLLRPYVQGPVEGALADILARNHSGFARLVPHMKQMPRKLAPLVARAVAVAGRAQGIDVLTSMLGRDRDLDLVLLPQIANLSESAIGGLSDDQFSWIRPFLGDEDWRVRREAVLGLGRMQDFRSYAEIIGRLSDEQRLVQQAALWSLRKMSGRNFEEDGERWRAWFSEESQWFETRGVVLIENLRDADPAVVVEAVRELVQRPLFKHEIAEAMAVTLHNSNPLVVIGAAAALAELGSVRAVRPLCEALSLSDAEARRAAHAALSRLTGQTWPLESEEWPRLAQS